MKGLKKEETKLSNKKLEIEAKLNLDDAEYKRKVDEINRQRNLEIKANTNSWGNIDSTKELKINTKYDNQISNLGLKMETSISKAEYQLEKIENQLSKNQTKQGNINKSIDEMNKKLSNTANNELPKTEKSLTNIISKVGKWTLAIFGIRSAYTLVRRAMSTLTQYNEEMASNIEYIMYALAKVLEPIIEKIISLVATLLSYINYLAKAWFGNDLFVSAKQFQDMKKSSAGIASNIKDADKTLAGWDEINKLEDNSSSESAGASAVGPSIDLTGIDDIEIPKWLQDFADFCKPIIKFFQDIIEKYGPVKGGILIVVSALAGFLILKNIINLIKNLGKATSGATVDFTGFFDALGKATEAIAILGGIALVIESITGLIESFSKSGMTLGEVAGLLGIILGELAGAFIVLLGVMSLMEPSWQSIAGAAVIFAGFAAIILLVNELLKTMGKTGLEVGDVGTMLGDVVKSLIALIGALTLAAQLLQTPLAMGGLAVLVASISAILLVVANTLPTILDACSKFINDIGPFVIKLLNTIYDGIDKIINALGENLPPIVNSIGSLFTKIFTGISNVIETVGDTIVKIMNTAKSLVDSVLQSIINFINQLGPAINNFVDNAIQAVTKLINFLISGIEYLINTLIIGAINDLLKVVNKIPFVDIPKLPKVTIERFVPRLATGGIVDVPKTGVNIGGAIAGEKGAEGVLPLTNEDTMRRLGEEIGKWITLNIDLTNTIDGRVLNKRLEAIRNNKNFARNGGF